MITVGMNYHVIAGKQADFEEKFATVINALRAAEGLARAIRKATGTLFTGTPGELVRKHVKSATLGTGAFVLASPWCRTSICWRASEDS